MATCKVRVLDFWVVLREMSGLALSRDITPGLAAVFAWHISVTSSSGKTHIPSLAGRLSIVLWEINKHALSIVGLDSTHSVHAHHGLHTFCTGTLVNDTIVIEALAASKTETFKLLIGVRMADSQGVSCKSKNCKGKFHVKVLFE